MKFIFIFLAILAFAYASKISEDVVRDLELKGGRSNVFIKFTEKANFKSLKSKGLTAFQMEEIPRGRFVVETLESVSEASQLRVKVLLVQHNIPFHSFFIDNSITVQNLPRNLIEQISTFEEVKTITPDYPVDFVPEPALYDATNVTEKAIEWNVRFVNAPAVWGQGYMGKNIIIANSDTGVDWNHPAIKKNYRGVQNRTIADHNFNWYDGSTTGHSRVPVDANGHGTHCMGTKMGEDGANQIGMAPHATWIACRSLGPGASRTTVMKCLEFLLAPHDLTGANRNPDRRPHITSHSYLCSGCDLGDAIANLKAAGIAVVVANGNSGPRCSSVTHPADLEDSFSVGALAQNSNNLASFSSRGPVTTMIKPNIAAPGQNVRSATPNNRYSVFSGTSMASPAVAGCMALLWDAVPELKRQVEESERILEKAALGQTAKNQCNSDEAPNNLFGHGTINIEKAIDLARQIYGRNREKIGF